jgi:hypothetical protein
MQLPLVSAWTVLASLRLDAPALASTLRLAQKPAQRLLGQHGNDALAVVAPISRDSHRTGQGRDLTDNNL